MIPEIKRILYTTDLSANSGYLLRYAINSAKKHEAKLIVLHVIEELSPAARSLIMAYMNDEKSKTILKENLVYAKKRILKRIEALCRKEFNSDLEANAIVDLIEVVKGHPADEILRKADEFNCDVIFMGTHGKGFLKHAYFGSTSKKVLRRVQKPVFILPLPEGESDITSHE